MNRYIGVGLLAALVVLLGAGLDNLGDLLPSFNGSGRLAATTTPPVGTQPIEQAGRVVQRQSEATGMVPTGAFDPGSAMIQDNNGPSRGIPPVEIRPQPENVIPRTPATAPATATTGDVDPIQEELIRPGASDLPDVDEDLDSIPALW